MPGGHRRRRGGYGYGLSYPVVPDYAVLDASALKSGCSCNGGSSSGVLGGLESWVKSNPLPALLGAFAVGWLVMGKKGRF